VNVFIAGSQGVGKSHLLSHFDSDNILRLDDFSGVKQTLGNLLLTLHQGDKANVIDLLTKNADIRKVKTKQSSSRIIDLIIKSCEKNEFTLIIDDLTNITKSGVTALEK